MKRKIGALIWNTSECLGFGLGRFAPVVFGWMIGSKGQKVTEGDPAPHNPSKLITVLILIAAFAFGVGSAYLIQTQLF